MGGILAIVSGFCFAMSAILVQRSMRKASVSAAVTVKLLVNNLVYGFMFLLVLKNGLPPFSAAGAVYAAAGGIAGHMLGSNLGYSAIRKIGAARTTLLVSTQILFTLVFGLILLSEVLTFWSFTGVCLILLGIYWLSQEQIHKEQEVAATAEKAVVSLKSRAVQGILLATLAGLAFGAADLFRKMGLNLMPSAVTSSAFGGLAALLVQSLAVTFQHGWQEMRSLDRKTWKVLLSSGTFSGLAIFGVNIALGYAPIAVVNALFSTRIWFVVALSPVILGTEEKVTKVLIASTSLIVAGVLLVLFN